MTEQKRTNHMHILKREPNQTSIKINAEPETRKGAYSNVAVIFHTENEFIIDFLLRISDNNELVSRIILSPQHTRKLQEALKINVEKYEKTYGKIKK